MTGKDEMAASSGGLQVDKEKSPAAEERTITAASRNSNMMRASAGKAGDGRKRKRKSGKR